MENSLLIERIKQKGIEIEELVNEVVYKPELVPVLIDIIETEKSSIKFTCEKILRLASERNPEAIYPYFRFYANLLDSDNTFLKCGAILTIANLVSVDTQNKFEKIFEKYYSIISDTSMICAANVIGCSVKIAFSKPKLVGRIVKEILKVEKAKYKSKGVLSRECRNVACGQAIKSFEELYNKIENKKPVVDFIMRQLKSTREPVKKNAKKFLLKYNIAL